MTNPCINCIVFPMCKTRFNSNPFISVAINKLSARCEILFDYITIKEPMRIIHLDKSITKGYSYDRDMKREAEVYTYYTGYNQQGN